MEACEMVRADLGAWLDDALASEDAVRVDAHVSTCASCQKEVRTLRAVIQAVGRLSVPGPSPWIRAHLLALASAEVRPFHIQTQRVERDGLRQLTRQDCHFPGDPPSSEPMAPTIVQSVRMVSADGRTIRRTTQTVPRGDTFQ